MRSTGPEDADGATSDGPSPSGTDGSDALGVSTFDPTVMERPVPGFRRFAARRSEPEPASETRSEIALDAPTNDGADSSAPTRAPEPDEPTVFLPDPGLDEFARPFAPTARPEGVEIRPGSTAAPADPLPAPRPSTGPTAQATTEPAGTRPTEAPAPRDWQGELDAAVGCAEWFDRRPVPAPPTPPAPSKPLYSYTAAAPAVATATFPTTFEPSPTVDPLRPVRAPRTEFDGGDVGAGPDRLAALLGYLLLIVGAPTAGAGLALALLLAWRMAESTGDWRKSHHQFQIRTAVIALSAGFACGIALFVDYVGILAAPVLVLLTGWVVLRAAVGLHHLFQGRPHPNYRTWLV